MLVQFKDLKIGDEILTPSYSKLKYLKVVSKTKSGNVKCSVFKKNTPGLWTTLSNAEEDVTKHNAFVYLRDEGDWRDYWLTKRDS